MFNKCFPEPEAGSTLPSSEPPALLRYMLTRVLYDADTLADYVTGSDNDFRAREPYLWRTVSLKAPFCELRFTPHASRMLDDPRATVSNCKGNLLQFQTLKWRWRCPSAPPCYNPRFMLRTRLQHADAPIAKLSPRWWTL